MEVDLKSHLNTYIIEEESKDKVVPQLNNANFWLFLLETSL
jgi:hypothetical protein